MMSQKAAIEFSVFVEFGTSAESFSPGILVWPCLDVELVLVRFRMVVLEAIVENGDGHGDG